jgi:hypothetical protein
LGEVAPGSDGAGEGLLGRIYLTLTLSQRERGQTRLTKALFALQISFPVKRPTSREQNNPRNFAAPLPYIV